MKKFITLIAVAFIILSLIIVSFAVCNSGGNNNTTITNPNDTNTNQTNETQQSNNQNEYGDISVYVTNKINLPIDYDNNRYSERVEFSFSIKNNGIKSIKGIKGVLTIKDLFGSKIIMLNCDFTGKAIGSKQTVVFEGIGIDINQFMNNHIKLYNEDYYDLIFEYEIKSVVYSDSATGSETTTESSKIMVIVIDKHNLPINYDANRYSPRVEFDINIANITSKSIKGIQGVLTIKDLFGEKIISLNCDFTGKIIPTNDNRTYEGIGFDINQFMDDHIKVYNENFEDLIFEYKVTKIIYSDGTQE